MSNSITCSICGMRRAKRPCPAISGDICPICCGTQREVTLNCPLDCDYLREAHRREKPNAEVAFSFAEINVTEENIRRDPELLIFAESIDNYLEEREKDDPLHPVHDSELLEVLVFLYRIGQQHLNGHPRGRRFIGVLRNTTPEGTEPEQLSLLV